MDILTIDECSKGEIISAVSENVKHGLLKTHPTLVDAHRSAQIRAITGLFISV
jgi:hypothetical protein